MTALRPVAWEAWVAEAKVWLRLHPREDHRGVPREERQRSFPKRAALWSLRLKTHLDETSEPNLANFAGSGRIPGARLVRCGRSTPFAPSATPITLSVDHASVLGGRGKRPALQIPHRPIASNSAATTTRLAGLFKWSPGPPAPHPTGGRVTRWHPRRRPVGPDGRRRVSGADNAVRVSPTQGVT